MLDFVALAQSCAPQIHENTLAHVVQIESGFNPLAIGVVGAHLQHQPRTLGQAIATAQWLRDHHLNFSVGLGQVNQANFASHQLTLESAFDPCRNIAAAAQILKDCYQRAYQAHPNEQMALRNSFSCYYSGNFTSGYRDGYVLNVVMGRTQATKRRREAAGEGGSTASSTSALLF